MDLATEAKTKELIKKAVNTKKCKCGSVFDFKNIRYFCKQSNGFYCKKCSTT
jgi:hypothetical protein